MQNVEWDFGMFQLKVRAIDGIVHYSGAGKRGTIPIDSISGVQYEGGFVTGHVIFLASGVSDGKLQVPAGKKSKEIVSDMNDYIREYKQEKSRKLSTATISIADELLKLKSLLDTGVITQDEFDTQKRRILG